MTRKPKTKAKTAIVIALIALAFALGIGLLLYPSISNWWNSRQQARIITRYAEDVRATEETQLAYLRWEAQAYNQNLSKEISRWHPRAEQHEKYLSLLNISEDGVMGYIEIPRIKVSLPIYHGTDMETLRHAVGHLEGSSLPVGGVGTHTVLSGHRGLPAAVLFSDLDAMKKGDCFYIHTLDEVLTYEVDLISIAEPADLTNLELDPEQDLATLFTCTPYGINTHRLMVRGHRVETEGAQEGGIRITAEATRANAALIVPVIALLILVTLLVWLLMWKAGKRRGKLALEIVQHGTLNEKTVQETEVEEEEV